MKKIALYFAFAALLFGGLTSCEPTKDGFRTPDGVDHKAPPPPPGAKEISNAAKKLFKKVPPPPKPPED